MDEALVATPFGRQTSVKPDPSASGRYRVELTDDWNAPVLPQGGIVTALAVRAMQAELDRPDQRLRSVTTVFAAQVPAGLLEVDTQVLRRGRSLSQVTATARPVGEAAGHTSVAVFGTGRPGFSFTDVEPPEVAPPEECPSFRERESVWEERFQPTFWQQVEGRSALGHAPWDDWDPTTSERAFWYRFEEAPRRADGTLDPLAVVALCDTMPGAVGERVGPGKPLWLAPSADLTVHVLGDARSEWLLAHNRARFAGDGYASLEMSMWDPAHGLVAYGTQMMFFSFPDGPPSDTDLAVP